MRGAISRSLLAVAILLAALFSPPGAGASTTKFLGAESGAPRAYVLELSGALSAAEVEAVTLDLEQRYSVKAVRLGGGGVPLLMVTLPPEQAGRFSLDPRVVHVLEREASAESKAPLRTQTDGVPRTAADVTWSRSGYQYDGAGNIRQIGPDVFTYDKVGRLTSGSVDGAANTQSYTYDAFGNRLTASREIGKCAGGTDCAKVVTVDSNTNHLTTGATYDAAGSLTGWEGWIYQYDAGGMMRRSNKGSTTGEYLYDADDERLGTWDETQWRWTVRDLGHNVVRELSTGRPNGIAIWNWESDHIYRQGQLLASETPTGGRHFHLDHLGTPRLVTDNLGRVVAKHSYYPFGSELAGASPEQPEERHKFTGHERDLLYGGNVDALDYMHARFYSAAAGRFLSGDPSRLSVNPMDPQSWNRYNYALNDPARFADRNGMWPTETHNAIIAGAFTKLTDPQRAVLRAASVRVDNFVHGGQSGALAYQHGMRGPFESPADARRRADNFIAENNRKAAALASKGFGVTDAALDAFGTGLHTVTDRTSPTHMGEQLWTGAGDSGLRYGPVVALVIGPAGAAIDAARAREHSAGEANITLEQYHAAIDAARADYLKAFGQEAFQKATGCTQVQGCAYNDKLLPVTKKPST
jgi:RHS repeat-associated protein